MRILKQIIGTLATGYILLYYSELMFWARVRPDDSLQGWVSTWLLYSLLGYILLTLIARFRISGIWALFLAGAVFGWLAEGLVVQTAYESLPLSISFTGLAWHALISVCAGWYAVRRALDSGLRPTLLWAAGIGLAYGFWAIAWWLEPDGGKATPYEFAIYSFSASLLLIIAYWIHDRILPGSFKPNRVAEMITALLLLAYFIFVTIPAAPLSAVILPVLLAGMYLSLSRNQQVEEGEALLDRAPGDISGWHYLALFALPLTASAFYALAFRLGLEWYTNWMVYLVTTPAGFLMLIFSLVRVWKRRAAPGDPSDGFSEPREFS